MLPLLPNCPASIVTLPPCTAMLPPLLLVKVLVFSEKPLPLTLVSLTAGGHAGVVPKPWALWRLPAPPVTVTDIPLAPPPVGELKPLKPSTPCPNDVPPTPP